MRHCCPRTSLAMGQSTKWVGVHQAQADALISTAVDDDRVSIIRLAYAEGSRLTARVRNVHVAWDEQVENDRARCLAFLVLELRRGEFVEFLVLPRVSEGCIRDRPRCRIAIENCTLLRPGRGVSKGE
jgi:hypothetical protein